jgi:DNA primase
LSRLSDELRRSLASMSMSYQDSLMDPAAKPAQDYLHGRGIDLSAASAYGIGLVNKQFDEHADYAGMLCFPYKTKLGGVVSLKFRRAHECKGCEHAKYISPYLTRIYNATAFDWADQAGYIAIAEGEIDALTLALCNIPAVGIPGVETWVAHPEWKELFRGYRRVYVFEDRDQPDPVTGKRPGEEFTQRLLKDIDTAVPVRLPGKDVNETYVMAGPDEIRRCVNV